MAEIDPERLAAAVGSAVASALGHQAKLPEVPAPLKWAAGILSAIAVTAVTGMGVWLVSTVADVQLTVTRMDERSLAQVEMQTARDAEINRRLRQLEGGTES